VQRIVDALKQAIQQHARELGFDDCRITTAAAPDHAEKLQRWLDAGQHGEMTWIARNAHKRVDPQQVLANAASVITLAVSYYREGACDAPPNIGVIARYAHFADYHDVLAERLKSLTEFVNQLGPPETRSLWYIDTGPLLERDLAQRAGLGFVGKHTNVISRSLGNWIFLAEIITTLPIEPDEPEHNRCGTCTRCISACPTGAITEPFNVDARLCISYLTIELKGPIPIELRPKIGNRIYGCDDCLAACPWNRFAREGSLMAAHARPEFTTPDLIELLSLNEAAFRKRFAGTPMLRTKRRGLLRNVCVALGNVGDERALPMLQQATIDAEPLIREHARWAIEKIQERGANQQPASRDFSCC
jgi:epoxyqueuosine reductase